METRPHCPQSEFSDGTEASVELVPDAQSQMKWRRHCQGELELQ